MTVEQIIKSIKSKMDEWDKACYFHKKQAKLHPEERAHHEQQASACNIRYVTLLYLLDEIEQGSKE